MTETKHHTSDDNDIHTERHKKFTDIKNCQKISIQFVRIFKSQELASIQKGYRSVQRLELLPAVLALFD